MHRQILTHVHKHNEPNNEKHNIWNNATRMQKLENKNKNIQYAQKQIPCIKI